MATLTRVSPAARRRSGSSAVIAPPARVVFYEGGANNPRAIRCYQKAGFVQEGCLRQAVFRNGRYEDEYRFAVLRDEWERGQQR